MTKEVLILGGNHQNPLGVIEALGQNGIMTNVIVHTKCKESFILKSKYIKQGWVCGNTDDIINCILTNFHDKDDKAIVYACSDNMASLLNDHYDLLSPFLIIPGIPQQGLLTEWMDKEKMTEEAARIGLNIPPTWLVHKKQIPNEIEYPCVTKSLSSVGNGKAEFKLCNNREELETFLREKSYSDTIQVQKFIDKEFEFQYIGCSLKGGEEIIIPGRTHIEVTTHFNNLTFLKYQQSKVINDLTTLSNAEAFIRHTGYSGLFSIEFMHGKDGKDYFLEMNFRNDGNGIVVTAAGTNLPYIWYLYCTGDDYLHELSVSTAKEICCVPEDSYFISMLQGEITFKQWRQNMKKCSCYITYFKDDTGPFWSLMWMMRRAFLSSIVKRILHIH